MKQQHFLLLLPQEKSVNFSVHLRPHDEFIFGHRAKRNDKKKNGKKKLKFTRATESTNQLNSCRAVEYECVIRDCPYVGSISHKSENFLLSLLIFNLCACEKRAWKNILLRCDHLADVCW